VTQRGNITVRQKKNKHITEGGIAATTARSTTVTLAPPTAGAAKLPSAKSPLQRQ